MTHAPAPNITVNVDLTNPGQFFACCGLLELADRLWPGAEGWFQSKKFHIGSEGNPNDLFAEISSTELLQLDPENAMSSPMKLMGNFQFALDWWNDSMGGGRELKVWAGSMRNCRIAKGMQNALADIGFAEDMFDHANVVFDPENPKKKIEPFYFDSRRGKSATSLDIGFSPDSIKEVTTAAFPAVEFLCLVGLQRFRPATTLERRVFVYQTWSTPLPTTVAPVVCAHIVAFSDSKSFRFENAFRTDQKKHKTFYPATPIKGATS